MRKSIQRFAVGVTFVLLAVVLGAATIILEPDDYTGDVSTVAPNAKLVTLRANSLGNGFVAHRVLSVDGSTWAPTGGRVFGHAVLSPGERAYHWDNLAGVGGAWACYTSQNCGEFKVLGVYFQSPAQSVQILTTMRGEQAVDPVELWAFNTSGQRILMCQLEGVTSQTLQTGVLAPPTYSNLPVVRTCGAVRLKKNCSSSTNAPGDCDYVVEMHVQRRVADIGFVWFGGSIWQNTHANVDALTYTMP